MKITPNKFKVGQVVQIAIDGPVAAGKSTVAKGVARELGYVYVDTGAMYRAVALYMEREGVSWENESAVSSKVSEVKMRLAKPMGKKNDGRPVSVYLKSDDVSWEIRNSHIGEGASVVSRYKKVREVLVKKQQQLANGTSVVMEGRDIGSRVLPKAQLRIFMTASVKARVARKWKYLKERGISLTKKQVEEDMMRRDQREMQRDIDPLRPVEGAWVMDTTGMPIPEVIKKIVDRVSML